MKEFKFNKIFIVRDKNSRTVKYFKNKIILSLFINTNIYLLPIPINIKKTQFSKIIWRLSSFFLMKYDFFMIYLIISYIKILK